MSVTGESSEQDSGRLGRDQATLRSVAVCLVIAATSWFLLKELSTMLRPLLLAVFLCYIIIPVHVHLKRRIPGAFSIVVLAGLSVGVLLLLTLLIYDSVVELNEEIPALTRRGAALVERLRRSYEEHVPAWLARDPMDAAHRLPAASKLQDAVAALVNVAANGLTEAVLVGIYLIFLLIEAGRLPERVQSGFSQDRSSQILAVVHRINETMASYLRVKVKASLLLALPVGLVLWAFGVHFVLMWSVLTFLFNFIPYLGSIVACSLPIALAFVQLSPTWKPAGVALVLILLHMLSAYLVEPSMTGKAVGLSPLVILVSLSFWGLCWGLTGMLLAVPLTVMLKIVLENVDATRPVARLLADE